MVTIEQLFRLDGKVALVTGGYGGIGAAVTRGLAQAGAQVAITGHNGVRASALAEALSAEGHRTWSSTFEATSVSETQRVVDNAAAHFGRLDILVNCIGLNREEKAEEVTEEMFDFVYAVNLKSAMFQAQAAARHMIRQGSGGKQVHLASARSTLALRGRGYAAYCAAKGGFDDLVQTVSSGMGAVRHYCEFRCSDIYPYRTGRQDASPIRRSMLTSWRVFRWAGLANLKR